MRPTKSKRRKLALPPKPDPRAILAAMLDRLADFELQHGHHVAAEQLARQAQAMREDRA